LTRDKNHAGDEDIGRYLDQMYHDPKFIKNCFDGNGHSWKFTDRKTCKTHVYVVCSKCSIRRNPGGREKPIQV